MISSLPTPVFNHLCRVAIEDRSPAYLLVSPTGQLLDWGGNWATYGIHDLQRGEAVCQQLFFLEGLLPLDGLELFLPRLKTDYGWCADAYFFPSEAGDWVLLLDASLDELQANLLQQYRNDLSLLQTQHAQLLHHQFSSATHQASHRLPLLPAGERRNLTILCAELREFVAYSEQHSAAAVFKVLNFYVRALIQAIVSEAGLIERLTGGTITAYFGLLPSANTAASRAIQAAQKIRSAVQEINQFRRSKTQIEFDVAIGIASGSIALGMVGNQDYQSLGAIGNDVNLATALQQQASPGEILIDQNTFMQATDAQPHFSPSVQSGAMIAGSVRLYSDMRQRNESVL
jgi:class 3 adenylate cyclase